MDRLSRAPGSVAHEVERRSPQEEINHQKNRFVYRYPSLSIKTAVTSSLDHLSTLADSGIYILSDTTVLDAAGNRFFTRRTYLENHPVRLIPATDTDRSMTASVVHCVIHLEGGPQSTFVSSMHMRRCKRVFILASPSWTASLYSRLVIGTTKAANGRQTPPSFFALQCNVTSPVINDDAIKEHGVDIPASMVA